MPDANDRLTGKGLIVAAPCSGSGKTLVTLGLLRALQRRGIAVKSAKAGPDYIDPQFHAKAGGGDCVNLDPWAMRSDLLHQLAISRTLSGPLLIEGMMGLFDGALDGTGSAADLASLLNCPVLLVVDAAKQSHSIAALIEGFCQHRKDVRIGAIVLNRVGSDRHELMLRNALSNTGVPVIGALRRQEGLVMPERHLGLVQAGERADLEAFIENATNIIDKTIDFELLLQQFSPLTAGHQGDHTGICPPGQRIAVARDLAFAFSYPHMLDNWRSQGAELRFFSPLADEAPDESADAVYLPGGYPELHAATLSANEKMIAGLLRHRDRGSFIYGECGGYMVLGEGLVDAKGKRHKMAGLLPLVTSFEHPKLHLGYRVVRPVGQFSMAGANDVLTAHEFHYASELKKPDDGALFEVADALGEPKGIAGLQHGNVAGSFIHLIDRKDT